MSNLISKIEMPSEMAVIVCEVRAHGQLWPLVRMDRRTDQHVHFVSGARQAPLGLQILQQCVELCLKQSTQLAAEQIAQGLLKTPSLHSPALLPQTAVSPETFTGDVMSQVINETADTTH